MKCDRCDKTAEENSYEIFDYCGNCLQNLCPSCMEEGCCGAAPAVSGMAVDGEDI